MPWMRRVARSIPATTWALVTTRSRATTQPLPSCPRLQEVATPVILTIDPAAHNVRAIRCYEQVGFRPVGIMREYWLDPEGVWRDGLLLDHGFQLLNPSYPEARRVLDLEALDLQLSGGEVGYGQYSVEVRCRQRA